MLLCDGFENGSPGCLSMRLTELFNSCESVEDKVKIFDVYIKFLEMDDYTVMSTIAHTSSITSEIF